MDKEEIGRCVISSIRIITKDLVGPEINLFFSEMSMAGIEKPSDFVTRMMESKDPYHRALASANGYVERVRKFYHQKRGG